MWFSFDRSISGHTHSHTEEEARESGPDVSVSTAKRSTGAAERHAHTHSSTHAVFKQAGFSPEVSQKEEEKEGRLKCGHLVTDRLTSYRGAFKRP